MKQPMLLERKCPDTSKLEYPYWVFPKLDGIRCLIVDGVPKTRTLKDVPNKYIREALSRPEYNGFDGELIVGNACSKSVYRDTNSVVMSHDKVDHFYYFVFDLWNYNPDYDEATFGNRQAQLNKIKYDLPDNIIILSGKLVHNEAELLEYEQMCLFNGYEGVVIRKPTGLYKQGRTTLKEDNSYKLKRFVDSEAEVIGMVEELENTNTKETNELGKGQRSVCQAGMVGKNTMGALTVRDLTTKITFQIGSGFTAEERKWFWDKCNVNMPEPVIVKYKSFMIGVKDKPRHPIYLGLRNKLDI